MNTNFKIATVSAIALGMIVSSALPSYAGRFARQHPRRAQVLGRDNNLNNRINANRGNLGGHYGQLKSEDKSIHRQEQRDAAQNGGHITKGEQNQLNREENHVNNQIIKDKTN